MIHIYIHEHTYILVKGILWHIPIFFKRIFGATYPHAYAQIFGVFMIHIYIYTYILQGIFMICTHMYTYFVWKVFFLCYLLTSWMAFLWLTYICILQSIFMIHTLCKAFFCYLFTFFERHVFMLPTHIFGRHFFTYSYF